MKPVLKGVKLLLFLAAAALLLFFFYRCPFRALFGISCPCCGMTRALLAALRGDLAAAFQYHPLLPFLLPIGLYSVLTLFCGLRIPQRQQNVYLVFLFAVFVLVFTVRLLSGDPILTQNL